MAIKAGRVGLAWQDVDRNGHLKDGGGGGGGTWRIEEVDDAAEADFGYITFNSSVQLVSSAYGFYPDPNSDIMTKLDIPMTSNYDYLDLQANVEYLITRINNYTDGLGSTKPTFELPCLNLYGNEVVVIVPFNAMPDGSLIISLTPHTYFSQYSSEGVTYDQVVVVSEPAMSYVAPNSYSTTFYKFIYEEV